MPDENSIARQVDQFILEEIDSVPHLEALLLVWNSRPREWPVAELARSLYIPLERAQSILTDMQKREWIVATNGSCCWNAESAHAELMVHVDRIYRRELIRISSMIHSKGSPAARQFARAFRLKKD